VSDVRGSVRLVVDATTGIVAQQLTYDPYGQVLEDTNPGFQPFGYAGGEYDWTTGLTRFGARDYDATIGRWTAKDPIGFGGGDTNLYAYVGGEPIGRVDVTGLHAALCKCTHDCTVYHPVYTDQGYEGSAIRAMAGEEPGSREGSASGGVPWVWRCEEMLNCLPDEMPNPAICPPGTEGFCYEYPEGGDTLPPESPEPYSEPGGYSPVSPVTLPPTSPPSSQPNHDEEDPNDWFDGYLNDYMSY
jgi:RHS repeat-associated protein